MSGSPFRERRIPPDEVRRIVKRAVDLAAADAVATDGGQALTEEELAKRLTELGIPAEIATRAMDGTTPATVHASPDGAIRVVREVVIEGVVPPDRHEEIAEAIASAMKMQGRVSVVGHKLTWVPGGVLTEPEVSVHSKNGRTHIHYVETLANRGQMTIGFATLACFSGLFAGVAGMLGGIAISKAAEISAHQGAPFVFATAAILGLLAAVASMLGLRRAFTRRTKNRSAFADEVMARVVTVARDAIEASPPRTRVNVPARVEDVSPPVEEADEEDEHAHERRADT